MRFFLPFILLAQTIFALDIPELTSPVIDKAGILTSSEQAGIAKYLFAVKEQKGPQIQLLIIPSLEGEILEDYSIKVVDKWKLGNQKQDNGVLFLIALQDRKMRIEVGQGLEGDLTDVKSNRIIRSITPYFKNQRFYEGIALGLKKIVEVAAGGDIKGDVRQNEKIPLSPFVFLIFIVFIFIISILQKFQNPYSRNFWGSGRRSGWGGGGGFGGGGGGSWGGGGGGFSGGGSSGSW